MVSRPRPPIAILDANVLYPFHLRNLMIQCAVDDLVAARWTDLIHEEWIRSLAAKTPTLSVARLRRTRDLMKAVLPDADVTGFGNNIASLILPDAGDRHVLAAAIACGAEIIVTSNVRDFPLKNLMQHRIRAVTPDNFLVQLCQSNPIEMNAVIERARLNLTRTAPSPKAYRAALLNQGLTRFVAALANLKESI